jgi:hypothetical protein
MLTEKMKRLITPLLICCMLGMISMSCKFRSEEKAMPYNIVDWTPFKRDPLKELAQACAAEGIVFGVYYSHPHLPFVCNEGLAVWHLQCLSDKVLSAGWWITL